MKPREFWKAVLSVLIAAAPTLRDVCVFGGIGAIAYGAAQFDPRLGWLAGGTLLLLIGMRS